MLREIVVHLRALKLPPLKWGKRERERGTERAQIPMRILAAAFFVQLLYLSSSCYGEDKTAAPAVQVVGFGECAECQKTNVKPSKAFQGKCQSP